MICLLSGRQCRKVKNRRPLNNLDSGKFFEQVSYLGSASRNFILRLIPEIFILIKIVE